MYLQMMDAVKQSFETGPTVDWGQFVGGGKGYAISEGNASEVFVHLQQYAPYVTFKVQEVLTADETMTLSSR